MIECRDSDIFISIPCLLILKSLEDDVSLDRQICKRFFPPMQKEGEEACKKYNELREEFNKLKRKGPISQSPEKQFIIKSSIRAGSKGRMDKSFV